MAVLILTLENINPHHGTASPMIVAVVMVGSEDASEDPIRWIQGAQRSACQDLLEQLVRQPALDQIVLVSPSASDFNFYGSVTHLVSDTGPVHVGRWLADLAAEYECDRILYFGGGSAPLLTDKMLTEVIEWLAVQERGVITNNRYASDWAGFAPASEISTWQDRLPKDNMIGWVLSSEAGWPVRDMPPSAPSRLDIDTPSDLLTLAIHSKTKQYLRRYLSDLPMDKGPLLEVLEIMGKEASQIFVAGRIAPEAWLAVNKVTQSWLRVISEERGMVSSGRMSRGEVYSFLAELVTSQGSTHFFENLAEHSDAALIDSRVLLAHMGGWPSEADRFASDLGLVDQISDPWLQEFTSSSLAVRIPVLLGGHGLLAGDLFALCEMI